MEIETVKPTPEQLKARRNRPIAIGWALVAFVVIVYVASLARMGPALFQRTF